MANYGPIMRSCKSSRGIFVDYYSRIDMIDTSPRQPHTAIATASFFFLGQFIQWFGDPNNLQYVKDFLSIISFMISIIVGLRSLIKKSQKRKS